MKVVPWLFLLFIPLTACTSVEQAAGVQHPSAESPVSPASQPIIAPDLAASVLLARWNAQQHITQPVDPATGEPVPGYAPLVGSPEAISVDSLKLALIESREQSCEDYAGGTACRGSADILRLVDLSTWHQVTTSLPGKGWAGPLAFSPDNTRLALIYHQRAAEQLMLFDVRTGQVVAKRALEFRPSLLAYTQDGSTLILYGSPLGAEPGVSEPGLPRLLLLDAKTLEVKWEQALPGLVSGDWCLEQCDSSHGQRLSAYWQPAVVLSPDQRQLYIVHPDADQLTVLDFEAQAVRAVELQLAQSWFERFLAFTAGLAQAKGGFEGAIKEAVFSPDGQRLYGVGQTMQAMLDEQGYWQVEEESLGLQVVEVDSVRQIAHRDSEATDIKITPDGAYLLLYGWGEQGERWTEVLDATSLERLTYLADWEVMATRRLDGQSLILATQYRHPQTSLAVLDPQSFDIVHTWSANTEAMWVTPNF